MLGKNEKCSPKWWFDGDLPWLKIKNHLQQIQVKKNGHFVSYQQKNLELVCGIFNNKNI